MLSNIFHPPKREKRKETNLHVGLSHIFLPFTVAPLRFVSLVCRLVSPHCHLVSTLCPIVSFVRHLSVPLGPLSVMSLGCIFVSPMCRIMSLVFLCLSPEFLLLLTLFCIISSFCHFASPVSPYLSPLCCIMSPVFLNPQSAPFFSYPLSHCLSHLSLCVCHLWQHPSCLSKSLPCPFLCLLSVTLKLLSVPLCPLSVKLCLQSYFLISCHSHRVSFLSLIHC